MRSAALRRPHAEMTWSMMPQGVSQKVCSHRWQRSAFCFGSTASPYKLSSSVAVATSSDADDESPPPSGTCASHGYECS